jgi:hypothetical protein
MPMEGRALSNRAYGPGAAYKIATISAICFLGSLIVATIWYGVLAYQRNRPAPPSHAALSAVAQKMRQYGGPAGSADRTTLCQHIQLNPDVSEVADTQSVYGEITVSMKSGVTEDAMVAFAKRLRDYMNDNFKGDRTYIVSAVDLQSPDTGTAPVTVCTGIGIPDHSPTASWHVAAKGKMIEW